MSKPICDFVNNYISENTTRLHMPGHKGHSVLGFEKYDITEIDGADELFNARGIIAESEKNASNIFGAKTFYSTTGSTLCIQAMLHLISIYAAQKGLKPTVAAVRNAHKSFFNAAALLGTDITLIYPKNAQSYISCPITGEDIERYFREKGKPVAVYLTSPDYLGNIVNIKDISDVCKKNDVLLAVDCAHGAYLKFLSPSLFPIDEGADICCTSAHKTLPVLTGGAYLHISENAPEIFAKQAKKSMALFASSSPSYLTLQSLDNFNDYAENFSKDLNGIIPKIGKVKEKIKEKGFDVYGCEPLKIVILPKSYGYRGFELSEMLLKDGIYVEFADNDSVVFMFSPKNTDEEIKKLTDALLKIERKRPIEESVPKPDESECVLSPKTVIMSESEKVATDLCEGRIFASATLSCPPAIPIAVYGEKLTKDKIKALKYYGITYCDVIKEFK